MTFIRLGVSFFILCLIGCANFEEDHYFRAGSDEASGKENYVRVRVKGSAQLSTARYIAGYYDERAVDLFFNEIKVNQNDANAVAPIFDDKDMPPGNDNAGTVRVDDPNGTFVMILSTNANSVANTIGNFAASNAAAAAITNIINKDAMEESLESEADIAAKKINLQASQQELEALLARIETKATANQAFDTDYMRLVNALARALGATDDLPDADAAKAWFEGRKFGVIK